jgi:streptogramin lyase
LSGKHVSVGSPSPAYQRPCGDIDPLGITSTPVYSAQTGEVYLVAEHGGNIGHDLIALDPRTGKIEWRKSVDLPGPDPVAMQQRGALAITGGRVWVSFGAGRRLRRLQGPRRRRRPRRQRRPGPVQPVPEPARWHMEPGGRVWTLDPTGGVLHALNPATGQAEEQLFVGVTSRFATPAIYGSEVLVPTTGGVVFVQA